MNDGLIISTVFDLAIWNNNLHKGKILRPESYQLLIKPTALSQHNFFGKEKETPIEVQTVKMSKGAITTSVTATGTVEPVDQVEVGTQVSGLVDKIYVDYNSPVKKGQLLAELDKTNLQESVNNALGIFSTAQDFNFSIFFRFFT